MTPSTEDTVDCSGSRTGSSCCSALFISILKQSAWEVKEAVHATSICVALGAQFRSFSSWHANGFGVKREQISVVLAVRVRSIGTNEEVWFDPSLVCGSGEAVAESTEAHSYSIRADSDAAPEGYVGCEVLPTTPSSWIALEEAQGL